MQFGLNNNTNSSVGTKLSTNSAKKTENKENNQMFQKANAIMSAINGLKADTGGERAINIYKLVSGLKGK